MPRVFRLQLPASSSANLSHSLADGDASELVAVRPISLIQLAAAAARSTRVSRDWLAHASADGIGIDARISTTTLFSLRLSANEYGRRKVASD